jgi:hypothetical protein
MEGGDVGHRVFVGFDGRRWRCRRVFACPMQQEDHSPCRLDFLSMWDGIVATGSCA